MARILMYTSPARGHLYPVIGAGLALTGRGHAVHVRTLASEVALVRSLGLEAEPIAPGVEAREMDDWRGRNPMQSLEFAMRTFADRGMMEHDVPSRQDARRSPSQDYLLQDGSGCDSGGQ